MPSSAADFTNTVTIIINEDRSQYTATFSVLKTLLTEKSKFFKAACCDEWKEASSRNVKVPEVDTNTFKAYIHWVCKEKISISSQITFDGEPNTAAESGPVLCDLVSLWLLADRFADTLLRHLTINAMLRVTGRVYADYQDWTKGITSEMVELVWSRTTASRALRRFIVDLYAVGVKTKHLERIKDELHPEFIRDLMMKAIRINDWEDYTPLFSNEVCHYHEHDDGENSRCKNSLRTLVIDYHISYVCIGDIQNAIDEYHPDSMKGLLLGLLADRLMAARLRNAAADAVLRVLKIIHGKSDMEDVYQTSTINHIWSTKPKDRAINRIAIDFHAFMVRPEFFESRMGDEDYHPNFVKDLASKVLSITHKLDKNQHPNEWQEQQAVHYHEPDKPHPRSNIHGVAEISLENEDEARLPYESTLFGTPQEYIDAAYRALGRSDVPEVKVQIKHDVWAVVKPEKWSESFGKVSAYDGSLWRHELTM